MGYKTEDGYSLLRIHTVSGKTLRYEFTQLPTAPLEVGEYASHVEIPEGYTVQRLASGSPFLKREKSGKSYYDGTECWDTIERLNLGFNLGNVMKYLWRSGRKTPDALKDLKKARDYLDREIRNRESE